MLKKKNEGTKYREFFEDVNKAINEIVNSVTNTCSINELKLNNVPVEINRDKKEFNIKTDFKYYSTSQALYGKNIEVIVNNDYVYNDAFIIESSPIIDETSSKIQIKIKFNNYYYKEKVKVNVMVFKKPFRLQSFDDYINANKFIFELVLNEYRFIVAIKDDKIYIYSEQKFDENEFMKYSDAIKLALGFVVCDFAGGEECYFSITGNIDGIGEIEYLSSYERSEEKDLHFDIFLSKYYMLNQRFSRQNYNAKISLSIEQFQNLCEKVMNKPLETALYYLSSSALKGQWIEHQLVLLACSFEALTRYFRNEDNNEKIIEDSEFKKILQSLKATVKEEIDKLNIRHDERKRLIEIFQNKLNDKFDNYISNNRKYKLPFEKYNIPYEPNNDVLKKRNSMLHGETLNWEYDFEKDVAKAQYYVGVYMYCIIVIILKMIGYNGYIVNPKKIKEITDYINNIDNMFHSGGDKKATNATYSEDFVLSLDFESNGKSNE